jgi:predicted Zn-dependent protease with MMP-like domain
MRHHLDRPPSLADIEAMAHRALETIPASLRARITNVPIRVQEFPDPETLREMELASEFDLLGLYRGVSLERRSQSDVAEDVDMIFLYRRPILDYWCEDEDSLEAIVRHVLIHEIGHHFGFSDAAMASLEDTALAAVSGRASKA